MDKFVTKKKQVTINQMYKKGDDDKAIQQTTRFFYISTIPFNCVKNPEFVWIIDMISRFGIGLKPPSYNEIRETCLRLNGKKGCSIMSSDGWSDKKKRFICNFFGE